MAPTLLEKLTLGGSRGGTYTRVEGSLTSQYTSEIELGNTALPEEDGDDDDDDDDNRTLVGRDDLEVARPKTEEDGEDEERERLFDASDNDSTATIDLTDLETETESSAPVQLVELPAKKGYKHQRWLWHKGLSVYKELFMLVFLSNLVAFLALLLLQHDGRGLALSSITTAVSANILAAVLVRHDNFINLVFWLATRWPTSAPFRLRHKMARVYNMGGVHSGCAVAATVWWVLLSVQSAIFYFRDDAKHRVSALAVFLSFLILGLLLLILVMAHPTIRARMHNSFEATHRFAGWSAIVLFWVQIVASAASAAPSTGDMGAALARTPALWMTAFVTLLVAHPWARLRRVSVVPEPLSDHAVRLHFDFCTPPPGQAVRLSDSPLKEWHAFATISQPGKTGFSVIVSRAGDWTGRCIDSPPTRLWTRGIPTSGVMRVSTLFKRIVLCATGSGIGPCLPLIMAGQTRCHVFWSTPNPEETYGQDIIDCVKGGEGDAVIWNTRAKGRPDMALEVYRLFKKTGAEAVLVVSNAKVTTKLVYELESRGVPAFGPIWDS